jgi:hypothetical protein
MRSQLSEHRLFGEIKHRRKGALDLVMVNNGYAVSATIFARVAIELNNYTLNVSIHIYIQPHHSTLGKPLWIAAQASKRGDPSNLHRRRSKWHTMVMMFGGGVVSVVNGILILFLPWRTYGVGVFGSRPNPDSA